MADGAAYAVSNRELLSRVSGLSPAEVEQVLKDNLGLVRSIAQRFQGRGVEQEDLLQIGSIGLLKAIRTFEPARGNAFSTYAVPLIFGEIRRYLRDDGLVKVSRIQKKRAALLFRAREEFLAKNGREPHLQELGDVCSLSPEEIAEALSAVQTVHSLSEPVGSDEDSDPLEQFLPAEGGEIERRVESLALSEAIGRLPELWRRIILLRYYRNYSQSETAAALGLSQVKISREEKKIFVSLRKMLE